MKAILLSLVIALLMVGCGEEALRENSQNSDDPENLRKLWAEASDVAINWEDLVIDQELGILLHPKTKKPYTGWSKSIRDGKLGALRQMKDGVSHGRGFYWWNHDEKINGSKRWLMGSSSYREGMMHGLDTNFYVHGSKKSEMNWLMNRLVSAQVWLPDGKKCPQSRVVGGNGMIIDYLPAGPPFAEFGRKIYKDGKRVED